MLPTWANTKEKKQLVGRAAALNADAFTLSDFDVCSGFVDEKTKNAQGKNITTA